MFNLTSRGLHIYMRFKYPKYYSKYISNIYYTTFFQIWYFANKIAKLWYKVAVRPIYVRQIYALQSTGSARKVSLLSDFSPRWHVERLFTLPRLLRIFICVFRDSCPTKSLIPIPAVVVSTFCVEQTSRFNPHRAPPDTISSIRTPPNLSEDSLRRALR